MAGRSWQIEGRYVEYCSCEHGCPCESMADPSYEEHRMITVLPEGWVFHEAESASGFAKGLGAVKFELSRRHSSLAHVAWNQNGLLHSYDEYKRKFRRP